MVAQPTTAKDILEAFATWALSKQPAIAADGLHRAVFIAGLHAGIRLMEASPEYALALADLRIRESGLPPSPPRASDEIRRFIDAFPIAAVEASDDR